MSEDICDAQLRLKPSSLTTCGNGTPIGPNDLLIAAIAIRNKLTLVTANTREFGRVAGLSLESWESAQEK